VLIRAMATVALGADTCHAASRAGNRSELLLYQIRLSWTLVRSSSLTEVSQAL
jgi:hypothetical protein